jgi:hypothetical protein
VTPPPLKAVMVAAVAALLSFLFCGGGEDCNR